VSKKRNKRTHLLLPDSQIKKGVPLEHLDAVARLICDIQPDVVVNIGDFWDMPSLSRFDAPGSENAEGQRIQEDIQAGNEAMLRLLAGWPSKKYSPEMHFLLGNHEHRISTAISSNPKLKGVLGLHLLELKKWKVHKFLSPVEIDGISYAHYWYNNMTGKALGGQARNMLDKIGFSFVQGHRQEIQYARKELPNGRTLHGLIAGAFHIHDEHYKGAQASKHWRGVCLLHDVCEGEYDLEVIGVDRLLREYGK
jgi:hypothetical protein